MRAGELRDRVTITSKNEVKDTHFGFTDEALVVAQRIPAAVSQLSGRELDWAQQIDARVTHQARIRYRPDVKAGMTVVHHDGRTGDRTYEIVSPPKEMDNVHRQLQLLCREAA